MLRRLFCITFALGLLFWISISHAQTSSVGQEAPDLALSTPDEKRVTLLEFVGKSPVVSIVLRGYSGYRCVYCVRQMHDFVENANSPIDTPAVQKATETARAHFKAIILRGEFAMPEEIASAALFWPAMKLNLSMEPSYAWTVELLRSRSD